MTLASATSSDTLLAGNITAMLVSGVVAVVVSKVKGGDEKFGWNKTLEINNPLTPWIRSYENNLKVEYNDDNACIHDNVHEGSRRVAVQ